MRYGRQKEREGKEEIKDKTEVKQMYGVRKKEEAGDEDSLLELAS